jgi:hypothetical protein
MKNFDIQGMFVTALAVGIAIMIHRTVMKAMNQPTAFDALGM